MAHGRKTGGRKRGTPNKATADLRQSINDLIDCNWPTIQEDIEKLEPKERLQFLEKLITYTLPKPQIVDVQANITARLNGLSDQQLGSLIDQILIQEKP